MNGEIWNILKSQPGVGVLIVDVDGRVIFANPQARKIYYGDESIDPEGRTIEELEGPEFAAERMTVIHEVIETQQPRIIRHIRRGLNTQATVWPIKARNSEPPRVLTITQQGLLPEGAEPWPVYESKLIDLGPLNVLTPRELQVMTLIGHGMPIKSIARELGVSQRTVERYRTDISRKLRVNSIAEIARIVQAAGLQVEHADMTRIERGQSPPRE